MCPDLPPPVASGAHEVTAQLCRDKNLGRWPAVSAGVPPLAPTLQSHLRHLSSPVRCLTGPKWGAATTPDTGDATDSFAQGLGRAPATDAKTRLPRSWRAVCSRRYQGALRRAHACTRTRLTQCTPHTRAHTTHHTCTRHIHAHSHHTHNITHTCIHHIHNTHHTRPHTPHTCTHIAHNTHRTTLHTTHTYTIHTAHARATYTRAYTPHTHTPLSATPISHTTYHAHTHNTQHTPPHHVHPHTPQADTLHTHTPPQQG